MTATGSVAEMIAPNMIAWASAIPAPEIDDAADQKRGQQDADNCQR
jgi:hypothetical protein